MRKSLKWFLKIVLFIFILDMGISVYVLMHDFKIRYPDLDFSTARLGVASWYSRNDKGVKKHTASGEKFNDTRLTCASWDFPFGTRLLVVNVLNGKWVVCRVNDRGPNKRLKREVDLTKAAFGKIANPKRGLSYVAFLPVQEGKKS